MIREAKKKCEKIGGGGHPEYIQHTGKHAATKKSLLNLPPVNFLAEVTMTKNFTPKTEAGISYSTESYFEKSFPEI